MKPPYRLPSMAEVNAVAYNGLKAISTFSGCGGSSLGYRMAGFEMVGAAEFIKAASSTYHANMPSTPIHRRDIRKIAGADLLAAAGLEVGELDLLDGSPPCASFSVAGKGSKDWGMVKPYSGTWQRTDDLFPEFIRLIRETEPRAFVAENVVGLTVGTAMGYYLRLREALEALPYRVDARILRAHQLGVPQVRNRLIIIGVRRDLERAPSYPAPLPYAYTLADACPWLAAPGAGEPPAPLETDQLPTTVRLKPCHQWHYDHDWPLGMAGPKVQQFTRARPDRPVPTIHAQLSHHAAGPYPPFEPRMWHLSELRLICGFPADFVLVGSFQKQAERLGRAVPPPMSAAIGRALAAGVFAPKELPDAA